MCVRSPSGSHISNSCIPNFSLTPPPPPPLSLSLCACVVVSGCSSSAEEDEPEQAASAAGPQDAWVCDHTHPNEAHKRRRSNQLCLYSNSVSVMNSAIIC